jgi:hypothetical protein
MITNRESISLNRFITIVILGRKRGWTIYRLAKEPVLSITLCYRLARQENELQSRWLGYF